MYSILYCTTPSKLTVYKSMGAERAADHTTAQLQWCHNDFALRITWIWALLSHSKIILWMKYMLRIDTRWLYFARRKKKKEFRPHPRYKPNAVVTPLRNAASYEPRIAMLGIWGDTWLTRGKYGIYVAVRGSYGALTGSTWRLLEILRRKVKSALSTVVSPIWR